MKRNGEDKYVVVLHMSICGMHPGTQCISSQVLRARHYWPRLHKDAHTFIEKSQEY